MHDPRICPCHRSMWGPELSSERPSGVEQAAQFQCNLADILDQRSRSALGQFMTPRTVATFMAGLFGPVPRAVRLLDAGAGAGMLTAAFVEWACRQETPPFSIDVTAFEVDSILAERLSITMRACAAECERCHVLFSWRVLEEDFLAYSARKLMDGIPKNAAYNYAILNPPYVKMGQGTKICRDLRLLGIETSNLYAAFVSLAIAQMATGGEIVAITPRSFCNGAYFRRFREYLLRENSIERIHIYQSRTRPFLNDAILQETIIYKIAKAVQQRSLVPMSISDGPDEEHQYIRLVPFRDIVHDEDQYSYIRLPVHDSDEELSNRVRSLPCRLQDLGVAVSTGKVVEFRVREHLRQEVCQGVAPLIYPGNFFRGKVAWPGSHSRKTNGILLSPETMPRLLPRGSYVLTKRVTSKEEKRRLVAAVYDPLSVDAEWVSFENHLNYFHAMGQGLDPLLARGLALFLNSTAVEGYFRQFSGHTQVNATDLRNLPYPTKDQLIALADKLGDPISDQARIDERLTTLL